MPKTQNKNQISAPKKTTEKKSFLKKQPDWVYYILDLLINGIIIVALVLFVRSYLIAPFQVSGQSMCNTLNFVDGRCLSQSDVGEYIIIDKLSYFFKQPQRGDIIVFNPPIYPDEYYVKRIIGLPGEKVKIENGQVWIFNDDYPEGFLVDEPYLNEKNANHTFDASPQKSKEYLVPTDKYFVLGDNRNGSSDSRHWRDPYTGEAIPYVNRSNIDGRVWLVLWPFQNIRMLNSITYSF